MLQKPLVRSLFEKGVMKFIAIALLLALAACGGGGGSGTPGHNAGMPPAVTFSDGTTAPSNDASSLVEPERGVRLPFPLETWRGHKFEDPVDRRYYRYSEPQQMHYDISRVPVQTAADARQMPVYHDEWPGYVREHIPPRFLENTGSRRRIFVGVDQGTQHIGDLPVTGTRNDTDIRHGHLKDGAGSVSVSEYLSEMRGQYATDAHHRSFGEIMVRYQSPPQVRFGSDASEDDINRLVHAVQLVNTALPPEWKMEIPSDTATSTDPERGIYVRFAPEGQYDGQDGSTGYANSWFSTTHQGGRVIDLHYFTTIVIKRDYASRDDRGGVITLAHEILHALGMHGHVSEPTASIMSDYSVRSDHQDFEQTHCPSRQCVDAAVIRHPLSLLYPVDREALRVLYGLLADDASIADFGPWSATSTHLHGNGAHAGFGVALRNGYAEPWAYGYLPDRDLAANPALAGSATWSGTLLGFTPDAETVAGDARIGVNLDTLAGRADFTALESWAAAAVPGEVGTGSRWGDGDLGYSIEVRGNTFKQTGGDDGILTGIFTGANHEGAAGTLEREDLTAAFGTSR